MSKISNFSIEKYEVFFMEYKGESYLRIGKDNWFCRINESYVPEYTIDKELEKLFNLFLDNLNI